MIAPDRMAERIQTFEGRAMLPFALDETPGADHLLVLFPKLSPGGAKPPVGYRTDVAALRAHRLFIGADPHIFIGPRRSMAGASTAIELMGFQGERLGV